MTDYRFVQGALYRFHIRGQVKTVAANDHDPEVHVVPTDLTSEFQIWIAELDEEHNQTRFRNYGTQAFLEKDEQDTYLKAESQNPRDYQNFLASAFGTGWHLKLVIGPVSAPVVALFDGSNEWLGTAENPTTIYEIDVVGPPKK